MQSRLARACAVGLALAMWLLASGAARAGLSLEAAIERDRQRAGGLRADLGVELREPASASGWGMFAGRWRSEAPALVGGAWSSCAGARWRGAEGARGTLSWQLGVQVQCGPSRPLKLEGSSLTWHLGGSPAATPPFGEAATRRPQESFTHEGATSALADEAIAARAPAATHGHELYASVQRRHWGPGWAGSLILDAAAPGIPALGWRHTAVRTSASPWLAWIGPWGADIFVGQLQGHRDAARPGFIGMRALLAPWPGMTVGLTRTLQWGGRGRDESASSLIDALLGRDNVGFDGITASNEPGNQLAGWDLHWLVDPAQSLALYAQVVGEDEAGRLPSRNMALVGWETRVPVAHGTLRLFFEWADLLAGNISRDPRPLAAYRHPAFSRGYTQDGVLLGHPAGGDVKLGTLGGLARRDGWSWLWAASLGQAEPTSQRFAPGRVIGFSSELGFELASHQRLGVSGAWWHGRAGRQHSVQVQWQWQRP